MGMSSNRCYQQYVAEMNDGKDYTRDLSNEQLRRIKELLGVRNDSDLEREYIVPVRETKKKKGGFQGFTDGRENVVEPTKPKKVVKEKKAEVKKPENKKLPTKVGQHYPKKKPSTDEQMEKISNFAKKAAPFVIPIAMTWITNKMMK